VSKQQKTAGRNSSLRQNEGPTEESLICYITPGRPQTTKASHEKFIIKQSIKKADAADGIIKGVHGFQMGAGRRQGVADWWRVSV